MNDRKLGLIAALSGTLILLVADGVEQFSTPLSINWDNSMYLQYAQLLLQGQTPFVDFTDVNPPLIIYLSVLPVFISNLVNVHVIIIAKWVMLALEFASCGLSAAILWRSLQSPAERIYAGVFITILATFNSFLELSMVNENIFLCSFTCPIY
jgi:hypothetical protein